MQEILFVYVYIIDVLREVLYNNESVQDLTKKKYSLSFIKEMLMNFLYKLLFANKRKDSRNL